MSFLGFNIYNIVLETPHVIVGAAIATKIPNPLIALPMALMSHFILEKVPHWNPHLNTEKEKHGKVTTRSTQIVVLDASLALLSGSLIAFRGYPNYQSMTIILLASLFSILPDLIEAPYFFLKYDRPWVRKWIKFQKSLQEDASPALGLFTQAITIIIALWWIL